MKKRIVWIILLPVLVLFTACTIDPQPTVSIQQTPSAKQTEKPIVTAEITPEPTREPTPTPLPPTPTPTPVPVLITTLGQEQVPMNEDYSEILVYVLKGTLDEKPLTLFLTEGGTEYIGKNWYCIFNDAWTGKRLLCRQSGSGIVFDAKKAKGDIIPLEYLAGDFKCENHILMLSEYLKASHGYNNEKVTMLLASGEVGTYQNMLDFYKAIIPKEEWYIAPLADMRAINSATYIEKFLINGVEKLLIVEHGSWKVQGKTRLFSKDLISGKMLYDSNDPDSKLLEAQTPPDIVPFTEFFVDSELGRSVTKEELLAFYQQNVPAEKQYIIQ